MTLRCACIAASAVGSLLAGCAAREHETRAQTTHAVAAPAIDDVLSELPSDALGAMRFDRSRVTSQAIADQMEMMLYSLPPFSALTRACGGDPITAFTSFTVSFLPDGRSIVVAKGPIAAPAREACARTWLDEIHSVGRRDTAGAPELRRRGDEIWFGSAHDLDAFEGQRRGTMPGANATPRLRLARAACGEAFFCVMGDLPSIMSTWFVVPPEAQSFWRHAEAFSFAVRATSPSDEVTIAAALTFPDAPVAAAQRAGVQAAWIQARDAVANALRGDLDPAIRQARDVLHPDVDRLVARPTVHATDERITIESTVSFGELSLLFAVTFHEMYTYLRRSRTHEAIATIDTITRAMVRQASSSRGTPVFLPSAPLTPANVPPGVRVVDPPNTWTHPTWRALSFEVTGPHRYSYEVVSDGSLFTARAIGDLDGDGDYSTFERVGYITPDGGVESRASVWFGRDLE